MKITLVVFVSVWLSAGSAWAVLGQSEASVSQDQKRLDAQLDTEVNQNYSVQHLKAANGTEVREYVSSKGLVFGIAWEGQKIPDLAELLGDYYSVYQAALSASVHRRAPVVVHTDDFVFEMSGTMRAFYGRAYLPNSIPNTLTPEGIK
jgi:hypothetical protein